jgi:ABC-type transporter Mla subunit MlaD
MPARVSWRHLVPGLIALSAILLIALGVLLFAGVGQVRGKKAHFYLATGRAQDVMRGSEVWIAGQKSGLVESIEFAPPTADSGGRIVIGFSVRARDADQLRKDSHADIHAGANIIGPIIVALEPGSPQSPHLRDGDTLHVSKSTDLQTATTKIGEATAELPALMSDARTIMKLATTGPLAKTMRLGSGGQVNLLTSRVSAFSAGTGASGAARVMSAAKTALARVDSIRVLVASPNTSFGRFRRDSTLASSIASVRSELAAVRASLDINDGTLGRVKSDSVLTRTIAESQREMKLLFDDIRRQPLRYIAF